ncbi:alpha/beta hydrolase fold domain-containing protein, partial [Nocardioides stalactiti]|uniref:alpha/beta hydrolase fold domain-containing protein n=1 Tax=Nocardioides stalactiti TaxID=2755356 RepID=UPI001601BDB3
AGGTLAASVALSAARDRVPVAWQLLIYPVTEVGADTPSRRAFGRGYYLDRDFIARADDSYLPDRATRNDPRISIAFADIPAGLAPAYLVTAGFDPLRDEGEAYAERMAEAGVEVEMVRFAGLIHGFVNIVGVGSSSRAAVDEIADRMRTALS